MAHPIRAQCPDALGSAGGGDRRVDPRVRLDEPDPIDDDNGIIAGHGRLLAARKLGMAEVPVNQLSGLSEAQRRALVVAASLTSFGTAGLTDPDDVPEPPEQPVTRAGDLWLLGNHRLVCGDSTDAADVERVLAGVKPHLCVTDPPFGVNYDPSWREHRGIASEGLAKGKVLNDDRADWREAWALFPGDVIYCWHAALQSAAFVESLVVSGFRIRSQIIWDKTRLVIGRGDYHFQHEPCWYAVRKGRKGHWAGYRKQTTIWPIPHRKSETGHITQKPVECMRRPIENNSSPSEAVFEPFCGSGTTIIAAEMTGRICHAIELNAAYVDVAVLRRQAFTGKEARLDGDGRSFGDIRTRRHTECGHGSAEVECAPHGAAGPLALEEHRGQGRTGTEAHP